MRTDSQRQVPRLIDVAEAAGVSRGTASNVFVHPELVRPEVRERVEAAARKLGYAGPDPKGRLLREGKFNALGYLTPGEFGIANVLWAPYGRELLIGVSEICDAHGVNLTIISGVEDRRSAGIASALVDGFVLGQIDDVPSAQRRGLPFVLMEADAGPAVNSVRIDGRSGARMAAGHLVALGHTRFAIMAVLRRATPPVFRPPGRARTLSAAFALDAEKLAGYAEGLAGAGIDIDRVPIVESLPYAPDAAALLFDRAPDATAILTMSDTQALLVLAEARRRGIDVPGDVSIVGFDNVPETAISSPPLTTIAQDTVEKGRIAARMVLRPGPARQVVMPLELVVRQSTAKAQKRR